MELQHSITYLENIERIRTSRVHQVENRISGLEDDVKESYHSSKDKKTKIHKRSIHIFVTA